MNAIHPLTDAAPVPPHNYEAEQALLGAILLDNRVIDKVTEYLRPEHFADPAHGHIYEACRHLYDAGKRANAVTLKTLLERDASLSEIGGTQYLAQLSACVVTTMQAGDYGRLVHDLHIRRELIALAQQTEANAYDARITVDTLREDLDSRLLILSDAVTSDTTASMAELGPQFLAQLDRARQTGGAGILTGLHDFDRQTGGLHTTDLVILAGRPGMGKSALAIAIAKRLATRCADANGGCPVALFSLEMSSLQLYGRMASEHCSIPYTLFRAGEVSQDQMERIVATSNALSALPLYIDDTPALFMSGLRTRARRLVRRHGVKVLIVDYLQLLRGDGRTENRVQEVSEITRGLKALAKELDVAVIALSQLSRAVEQREDKRPMLSDLRESGSIEQDADAVLFAYRDEYYLSRSEPNQRPDENATKFNDRYSRWQEAMAAAARVMEVIASKQRHGPIGTIRLRFDAATNTVESLAQAQGEF